MNPLDTQRLFLDCPYPVKQDGSEYTFKTEHDIVYSVDFKEEQTFSPIPAYWFDLTNLSHKPSPNDPSAQRNRPYCALKRNRALKRNPFVLEPTP